MFECCSRDSWRRHWHSACHSPPNHMLTSQLNVKQYKLWLGLSVLLFVQTLSISHSLLILKEKPLPCWLNKLQTSLQPTELLFLSTVFFLLLLLFLAPVSPTRCLSAQGSRWMNSRTYVGKILGFLTTSCKSFCLSELGSVLLSPSKMNGYCLIILSIIRSSVYSLSELDN